MACMNDNMLSLVKSQQKEMSGVDSMDVVHAPVNDQMKGIQ